MLVAVTLLHEDANNPRAEFPEVVLGDLPVDRYAQVAENQRRHGLTPLEMAKFIRERVDCGDSNVTIATQLGMNLTTVAHDLSLLELRSELDEALESGRCTSPRTLHELSKLHADNPEQVQRLLGSGAEINLPQPLSERQADRAVLLASNDRIATLSTDIVALVTLLRQSKVAQARPCRDPVLEKMEP